MTSSLGSAPGIMIGVGVGTAASAALEPVIEPAKQQAWFDHPNKILDAGTIARLVAQGGVVLGKAVYDEVKRDGYDQDKLNALVYLAQTVPGFAQSLEVWRRNPKEFASLWTHSLIKNGIDARYLPYLNDLRWDRLSLPVIALGIVRGLVKAPFDLPFTPPTGTGKVQAFPTSGLDATQVANDTGFTVDDLFLQTAISGRPMGPESAASAVFRGILEKVDYERAVLEGDVRGEWADSIFETARQIPSVSNFVTAHLKAWINEKEMLAGAARHGMSEDDVKLLFLAAGRPAAPGQMATAAARKIAGPAGKPMDEAQFLKGIAESDIRPEWGPMLWESRFLYPPLFQLTRLVQAGAITADVAAEWATKDRYPPEVVTALHAFWSQPVSGTDPDAQREKLAVSQAIASLKKRYLAEKVDGSGVIQGLELLGVKPAPAGRILETWTIERGWTEKLLTPSQIKKAYKDNQLTQAEAVQALMTQYRYSEGDAMTLLTE